jgi:hypothetical protein
MRREELSARVALIYVVEESLAIRLGHPPGFERAYIEQEERLAAAVRNKPSL